MVAETLEFIRAGEGARVADEVPMKLCLADGHRALFSLTDPIAGGLTSTNILVEHPSLDGQPALRVRGDLGRSASRSSRRWSGTPALSA